MRRGIDGSLCIRAKQAAPQREDRLLHDRSSVCVLAKSDLQQHRDDYYLLRRDILQVYRLYGPNAALQSDLDKKADALKWVTRYVLSSPFRRSISHFERTLDLTERRWGCLYSGNAKRVELEAAVAGLRIGATAWIVENGQRVALKVVRFDRERVIAQRPVQRPLEVGTRIQGRFPNGRWYNATVADVEEAPALSYTINWEDGDENHRRREVNDVRNSDGSIPLSLPYVGDGRDICVGSTVADASATSEGAFKRFPVFTRTGGMVVIEPALDNIAEGQDFSYDTNWGVAIAQGPGMRTGSSYVEFDILSGATGWGIDDTDVPIYVGLTRSGLTASGDPCNSKDFFGIYLRTCTSEGTASSGQGRLWHAAVKTEWEGMQGAGPGDTVGMLLDFDRGSLSVYLNGEMIGMPIAEGLTGELHWCTSFFGVDLKVQMTAKPPPGSHAGDFHSLGEGWVDEQEHRVGGFVAAGDPE